MRRSDIVVALLCGCLHVAACSPRPGLIAASVTTFASADDYAWFVDRVRETGDSECGPPVTCRADPELGFTPGDRQERELDGGSVRVSTRRLFSRYVSGPLTELPDAASVDEEMYQPLQLPRWPTVFSVVLCKAGEARCAARSMVGWERFSWVFGVDAVILLATDGCGRDHAERGDNCLVRFPYDRDEPVTAMRIVTNNRLDLELHEDSAATAGKISVYEYHVLSAIVNVDEMSAEVPTLEY